MYLYVTGTVQYGTIPVKSFTRIFFTSIKKNQKERETMPRRGGKRKKKRTHVAEHDNGAGALISQEALKIPKSLVVSSMMFCYHIIL